jgi:hypothetical protein
MSPCPSRCTTPDSLALWIKERPLPRLDFVSHLLHRQEIQKISFFESWSVLSAGDRAVFTQGHLHRPGPRQGRQAQDHACLCGRFAFPLQARRRRWLGGQLRPRWRRQRRAAGQEPGMGLPDPGEHLRSTQDVRILRRPLPLLAVSRRRQEAGSDLAQEFFFIFENRFSRRLT